MTEFTYGSAPRDVYLPSGLLRALLTQRCDYSVPGVQLVTVEIEIKLRLLEKPNDLSCAVEYSVPSLEEPLYRVCISNNLYVIYDVA
ncbi:MAG: hypothetical protein QW733_07530, partial [Desulfurococcaceae archaeon]